VKAQGREEPFEASPFQWEIIKELQKFREAVDGLVQELGRGETTRREALRALEGIRSGLKEFRARVSARFWQEPPGSAGRWILEGALATLDGLDSWLQELQERWGSTEPRWT
jgi:hypothetical protein